ncbi:hypothetical protein VDQ74_05460 [Xanthomonas campestris pv. campestris]|nr:hypothetical protein [Xanthomonas campestris pv. campestris]
MESSEALEELAGCKDVGFVSLKEEPEFELCIIVSACDPERLFEIRWSGYISYAVRSEHYCQWDDEEVWEGRHVFRTYTKSKFLDFVAAGTFANDTFPGRYRHYQIQSLYPIIDVASQDSPRVRLLQRA